MRYEQKCVQMFHNKFGQPISLNPTTLDMARQQLRFDLIEEELSELDDALLNENLVGIADALGDLLYVVYGCAVECGIDLEPVFDMVHESNMSKEGGGTRADGKILKPEGWQPPDIAGVLARQAIGWDVWGLEANVVKTRVDCIHPTCPCGQIPCGQMELFAQGETK